MAAVPENGAAPPETATDEAMTTVAPVPVARPQQPEPQARQPEGQPAGEKGGPKGPEPTRYGDWEKGGRCFDF